MHAPQNGRLIYANEHGRIGDNQANYSMGTFVEVQCENDTMVKGDGFLSCIESGIWDLPVPECVPFPTQDPTIAKTTTMTSTTISITTSIKPSPLSPLPTPPITTTTTTTTKTKPTITTKSIKKESKAKTRKPINLKTTSVSSVDPSPNSNTNRPTVTVVLPKLGDHSIIIIQTQTRKIELTTKAPTPKLLRLKSLPDKHFWLDLKQLYYYGCNNKEMNPILCAHLENPSNYTDLTLYLLPDTNDFKHMDQNLLTHLTNAQAILNSKPDYKLTIEQLFPFILYGNDNDSAKKRMPSTMENAYRFVLCLYIDTIQFDRNSNITFLQELPPNDDNITQKLKYFIVHVTSKVFDEYSQANYLHNEMSILSTTTDQIKSTNGMSSIQSDSVTTQPLISKTVINSMKLETFDTTKMPLIVRCEECLIENSTREITTTLENESIEEICQLEALPDIPSNSYINEIKIENEKLFDKPDRLILIGPILIRTRAYVTCREGFKSKENRQHYFECSAHLKWTGKPIECEGKNYRSKL